MSQHTAIPCTPISNASGNSPTHQSSPDKQWLTEGSGPLLIVNCSDANGTSTSPNSNSDHLKSSSYDGLNSPAHNMISDDVALDSENDSKDRSSRTPSYGDEEDEDSPRSSSEADCRGDQPCGHTSYHRSTNHNCPLNASPISAPKLLC